MELVYKKIEEKDKKQLFKLRGTPYHFRINFCQNYVIDV